MLFQCKSGLLMESAVSSSRMCKQVQESEKQNVAEFSGKQLTEEIQISYYVLTFPGNSFPVIISGSFSQSFQVNFTMSKEIL